MEFSGLLMGILPLVAFVIADSFLGMKAALIFAIVFALAEAVFSFTYFGEVDSVTFASMVLVCLMAFVAFKEKSRTVFLFQPVILSAGIGLYLLISHFFGHPIFLEMMLKYRHVMPEQTRGLVLQPHMQNILRQLSLTVGIGSLIHAGITAFAALRLNKWWWIAIRGIGSYVIIFLAYLAAVFLVS